MRRICLRQPVFVVVENNVRQQLPCSQRVFGQSLHQIQEPDGYYEIVGHLLTAAAIGTSSILFLDQLLITQSNLPGH